MQHIAQQFRDLFFARFREILLFTGTGVTDMRCTSRVF